jgi:hypothetical protein
MADMSETVDPNDVADAADDDDDDGGNSAYAMRSGSEAQLAVNLYFAGSCWHALSLAWCRATAVRPSLLITPQMYSAARCLAAHSPVYIQ